MSLLSRFSLFACLCALGVPAQAADAPVERERHVLRQVDTGTGIGWARVVASLPFGKPYDQLTVEQKTAFKTLYEPMPDADEPPYPVKGLGALYKSIADANDRVVTSGALVMEVKVEPTGEASSVSIYQSPDDDVARAAAKIAMLIRYKPAVCSGVPCAMGFPIRVQFIRRL